MHTFNIKLDSNFDLTILIEVQMKFGIKNYKELVTTPKAEQSKSLIGLQSKAYDYYKELADEYRRVINEKDIEFSQDSETNLPLMKINFKDNSYFKEVSNEWFEISNSTTEMSCISQLTSVLSHIEDTLDELK